MAGNKPEMTQATTATTATTVIARCLAEEYKLVIRKPLVLRGRGPLSRFAYQDSNNRRHSSATTTTAATKSAVGVSSAAKRARETSGSNESGSEGEINDHNTLTEAERRHRTKLQKQNEKKTSHDEQVSKLNKKLDAMSDHFSMPRISHR